MKLKRLNKEQIDFLALEMNVAPDEIIRLFLNNKETLIDKSMSILSEESEFSDTNYEQYNPERADMAEEIMNLLLDYVMMPM